MLPPRTHGLRNPYQHHRPKAIRRDFSRPQIPDYLVNLDQPAVDS